MKKEHDHHKSYKKIKCGLVISPEYPVFGASPDGISSCSCCKEGSKYPTSWMEI